jgi:hypothetical protein
MKINVIAISLFALFALISCKDSNCFCDEDITLYQNSFESQNDIIGWNYIQYLQIVESKFDNSNSNALLIRNSGKTPRANFEFISHNNGKAKIKFNAINYADNVECVFRNISKPQQIVIPISSKQYQFYDYSTLLDISVGDNISVEFYSSSSTDSLLLVDNIKIVLMK